MLKRISRHESASVRRVPSIDINAQLTILQQMKDSSEVVDGSFTCKLPIVRPVRRIRSGITSKSYIVPGFVYDVIFCKNTTTQRVNRIQILSVSTIGFTFFDFRQGTAQLTNSTWSEVGLDERSINYGNTTSITIEYAGRINFDLFIGGLSIV